jgi:membrane protein required for colicin V production
MSFPVQPYDVFMLGVLFCCALYGAWRGLAWEVTSVAAVVLSVLVAGHFSGPLAPMLSSEAPWNRFLAMLVLYIATSLGIWLAFRVLANFVNRLQLKEFDRQLGALAGAAKGALWCIVITFFTVTLSEPARQTVLRSRSGYYIAVATHRAMPLLPRELRDVLGKYIEELDEKLDPRTAAPLAATAAAAHTALGLPTKLQC